MCLSLGTGDCRVRLRAVLVIVYSYRHCSSAFAAQRNPMFAPAINTSSPLRPLVRASRDPAHEPPRNTRAALPAPPFDRAVRRPGVYHDAVHSLTLPPRSWTPSGVTSCAAEPTGRGPVSLGHDDGGASAPSSGIATAPQRGRSAPHGNRRSRPRAAASHSSSVGRRFPIDSQYSFAPYQVTCETGSCSRPARARYPASLTCSTPPWSGYRSIRTSLVPSAAYPLT